MSDEPIPAELQRAIDETSKKIRQALNSVGMRKLDLRSNKRAEFQRLNFGPELP